MWEVVAVLIAGKWSPSVRVPHDAPSELPLQKAAGQEVGAYELALAWWHWTMADEHSVRGEVAAHDTDSSTPAMSGATQPGGFNRLPSSRNGPPALAMFVRCTSFQKGSRSIPNSAAAP